MWLCALLALAPPPDFGKILLPDGCSQIVLVTSNSWKATVGELQVFELAEGKWKALGLDTPVALGQGGLGWGKGVVDLPKRPGPNKVQADGRSPAGIFSFTGAFGIGPKPADMKFDYHRADDRDYWVTDQTSTDYNTWQRIKEAYDNEPDKQWKSFELMKAPDGHNDLGLIVNFNASPMVRGAGSAVFLNVGSPEDPTQGSTAMPRGAISFLLAWLDPAKAPVLVEMPMAELQRLAKGASG
jgi:L,D-peptidoglycan transpeptidase YkuD (ErfK/YbiS/YcfS/YnhG family)